MSATESSFSVNMASESTTNLVKAGGDNDGESFELRPKPKTSSATVHPDSGDNLDGEDALSALPFSPLLNTNQYTVRKMAAQAMMDVALMMANISQLRTLISGGVEHISYFPFLLGLVAFSLLSQVVFGILIFVIWVRESTDKEREDFERTINEKRLQSSASASGAATVPAATSGSKDKVKAAPPREPGMEQERIRLSIARRQEHFERDLVTNRLNHVTMVLVFLITVTNMFITGFGIETPDEWGQPHHNTT